jgi:hypothetical protein
MPRSDFDSTLEKVFVPHTGPRATVPAATHVRGTVILSSLRGLRSRGYERRYLDELDDATHATVASLTAATWLPIDFAMAHYQACDRLGLDKATIEAMGEEAGRFINQTVLTVVAKLSRESGMTPWFALSHAPKLMGRTWRGSSMAVWQCGPKDARIEWIQQPLSALPYFRIALRPFLGTIVGMFAEKHFMRELPRRSNDREVSFRASWV